MKKVYICSPFRADNDVEMDRNIDYAQQLTKMALQRGYAPITPHLYITQCLNDKDAEEREMGMTAALALMRSCDELWIGDAYGISAGMRREIREATRLRMEKIWCPGCILRLSSPLCTPD